VLFHHSSSLVLVDAVATAAMLPLLALHPGLAVDRAARMATLVPLMFRKQSLVQLASLLKTAALFGTSFVTGMLFYVQEMYQAATNTTSPTLDYAHTALANLTVNCYANTQQSEDYRRMVRQSAKMWQRAVSYMPYQMANFKQAETRDWDTLLECGEQLRCMSEVKQIFGDMYAGNNALSRELSPELQYAEDGRWYRSGAGEPFVDAPSAVALIRRESEIYRNLASGPHVLYHEDELLGKSTARKSTARKSTARKSTARKSTARKSTAKKSL